MMMMMVVVAAGKGGSARQLRVGSKHAERVS